MTKNSTLAELFRFPIPDLSDSSSLARQGLQRLLLLRTFVTVVGAVGLLVFETVSSLAVPYLFITVLILAVLLSVLLGYWRLQAPWPVGHAELIGHLMVDVVFLMLLLWNTGGVGNPLISYLLVLLAVAATLLPAIYVYFLAFGGIVVYTFFLLLDLGMEQEMNMGADSQQMTFQLHLIGMWVIFLVSAILITVFVTRMAKAIQSRELNLARARETELRNEQLVAIGTLAAGTAHALGTPLSTMAILLTELDKLRVDQLQSAEVKEDISVLKQQVTRCKNSLIQLIRYYHKDTLGDAKAISPGDFVSDIKDYITNIHPSAHVDFTITNNEKALITADLSVKHAVINIIENAIKAANTSVVVNFDYLANSPTPVSITITDDGPGIPAAVLENQGEPFITMRKEGMGLGIFLANASIQRHGGSIEMVNLTSGGALTQIKLPLPA